MSMPISDPRARILMLALDDWVSLAAVVSVVGRTLDPVTDDLRAASLEVLTDLINGGLMVAGDLNPRFTPWTLDARRTLEVIDSDWTIHPADIDQGHGWWFDLTPAGEARGQEFAEARKRQRES